MERGWRALCGSCWALVCAVADVSGPRYCEWVSPTLVNREPSRWLEVSEPSQFHDKPALITIDYRYHDGGNGVTMDYATAYEFARTIFLMMGLAISKVPPA